MILYNVEDVTMPRFPKRKISQWIKQIAKEHGKRVGDISYIFCSEDKILEINKAYLDHDYYTDIITFDYTVGDTIAGDIFVSIETVKTNASDLKISYMDELYRVIIHGILHLCGIDDTTPEMRLIMEKSENIALNKLLALE